jgi:hypothetical protein
MSFLVCSSVILLKLSGLQSSWLQFDFVRFPRRGKWIGDLEINIERRDSLESFDWIHLIVSSDIPVKKSPRWDLEGQNKSYRTHNQKNTYLAKYKFPFHYLDSMYNPWPIPS